MEDRQQKHELTGDNTNSKMQQKKPYKAPRLNVFGSVQELTQAKNPGIIDGINSPIVSDRDLKENIAAVDVYGILNRVASLPIQTWNYKSQDAATRHIGPMAQDFAEAFNVGSDNRHIDTVDANGVALASIQALARMIQERDGEIAELRAGLTMLKAEISALKASATPVPVVD
jgi:hypothetical protein